MFKHILAGFACLLFAFAPNAAAQNAASQTYPAPVEGDFVAQNYTFKNGETLPEVKIHYRTVGTPRKDSDGVVRNGVLILHGRARRRRTRMASSAEIRLTERTSGIRFRTAACVLRPPCRV
jgi:hypothetical protein